MASVSGWHSWSCWLVCLLAEALLCCWSWCQLSWQLWGHPHQDCLCHQVWQWETANAAKTLGCAPFLHCWQGSRQCIHPLATPLEKQVVQRLLRFFISREKMFGASALSVRSNDLFSSSKMVVQDPQAIKAHKFLFSGHPLIGSASIYPACIRLHISPLTYSCSPR